VRASVDELQARAAQYARLLSPGARIVDGVDDPYVDPFRHLLPQALAARGLYLEREPGAWLVRRRACTCCTSSPCRWATSCDWTLAIEREER